jgi:UDP-3-O-[3-hydroxymyristoyl] N-acetylglucosamine deacetylase
MLTCVTEFPVLGRQSVSFDSSHSEHFKTELAPARTFGFAFELDALRAKGLAKGATMENAVLLTEEGPAVPLRFPDEPARHKLLDLIGDLAALGRPLAGHVYAYKSGHALNQALVQAIDN